MGHAPVQNLAVALTEQGESKLARAAFRFFCSCSRRDHPHLEWSVPHHTLSVLLSVLNHTSSEKDASFLPARNLTCSSVPETVLFPAPRRPFLQGGGVLPIGVFGLLLKSFVKQVLRGE